MPPPDAEYTIADLARLTGLNVRTIRYWISQGLIPASGESGPGAHYGQGHLDRLRLIRRLQAEYLPNAEIRRRLAPLSDAEVAGLVGSDPGEPDPTRPTTSALEYIRGLLAGESTRDERVGQPPATTGPAPAPPPVLQATAARPAPPARRPFRPTESPPAAESLPKGMPRLADVDPERWMRVAEAPAPFEPSETPAASMPERSQWERLSLGPNIELHIRRPLSRPEQRRVERLITIARQVLDEDKA